MIRLLFEIYIFRYKRFNFLPSTKVAAYTPLEAIESKSSNRRNV